MKATDLMIGDWVRQKHSGLKLQVSEIHQPYIFAECEEGQFREDTIESIPLAPEILKKNGFENIGAHFLCDSIGMIWWKDNIYIFSKYARHKDLPTENISINIGYVHELQHALRLCGIDKEIEL